MMIFRSPPPDGLTAAASVVGGSVVSSSVVAAATVVGGDVADGVDSRSGNMNISKKNLVLYTARPNAGF